MDLGGTAFPNLNLYYLAAQMPLFFYFDKGDKECYISLACSHISGLVTHPYQSLLSGTYDSAHLGGHRGLVYHHCKVLELAVHKMKAPSMHAHTPLWGYSCLPELLTVPDFELWIAQEGIYLSQLITSSGDGLNTPPLLGSVRARTFEHHKISELKN